MKYENLTQNVLVR